MTKTRVPTATPNHNTNRNTHYNTHCNTLSHETGTRDTSQVLASKTRVHAATHCVTRCNMHYNTHCNTLLHETSTGDNRQILMNGRRVPAAVDHRWCVCVCHELRLMSALFNYRTSAYVHV